MTFSFLALDRTLGVLGVATASRSLAVGAGVPGLDPAAGVVVSQAWTNRVLRALVLERLRAGVGAPAAVDLAVARDGGARFRQVGAVGLDGSVGVFTGAETTPWAGHRTGEGWLAVGNLLAGPDVLDAMVEAFHRPRPPVRVATDAAVPAPGVAVHPDGMTVGAPDADDPAAAALGRRLLDALRAGERVGGDRRGR
ncbi:MAG TPA: hypothetical protein DHV14_13205, partial [Micrococcales bacterium]|nr:hypothetical protein [Micrococcales bacterium]